MVSFKWKYKGGHIIILHFHCCTGPKVRKRDEPERRESEHHFHLFSQIHQPDKDKKDNIKQLQLHATAIKLNEISNEGPQQKK